MTSCVGTEEVNFSDIVVGRVARSPRSDMFLRQIRCLSAFDRMERKENFPLSTFSTFEVIVLTHNFGLRP